MKQTAGLLKSYYKYSPQTTWAVKFVEWFRLTIYDLQKTWKTYGGTTSTIKLNKLQQTGSQGLQIIVMQEHGHNTWQELLYHSKTSTETVDVRWIVVVMFQHEKTLK